MLFIKILHETKVTITEERTTEVSLWNIMCKGLTEFQFGFDVFDRKMKELKSKAATGVNQQADPSCMIWFVCKGKLIYTRYAYAQTICY